MVRGIFLPFAIMCVILGDGKLGEIAKIHFSMTARIPEGFTLAIQREASSVAYRTMYPTPGLNIISPSPTIDYYIFGLCCKSSSRVVDGSEFSSLRRRSSSSLYLHHLL